MAATPPRPRPVVDPLRGADWLAARAALAIRRTRRFTRWWLTLGGAATVVALLLPVAARDQAVAARSRLDALAADTLQTARRLSRFVALEATADSQLAIARVEQRRPAATSRPARAASTDPRLPSLEDAIRVARQLRTSQSFLALAADPAVASGPRMQAVADTLGRAATLLGELPAADSVARADARAIITRLGVTIIAIAEYRRNTIVEAGPVEAAPTPAPAAGPAPDTMPYATRVRQLGDSVAAAQTAHAASLAAMQADSDSTAGLGADAAAVLSPGLAALAILLLGLAVRLFFAMSREMRSPRIASTLEAERTVGAPVLAVVSDALPDGPVRFKPSGVDPFRVLYLGLTSTGTRTRALIVTGEDPVLNAAVGARLAIAAAADHRATLVADLDTEQIALARIFRAPPEPGFSDALAGAFKWREVARSVGSSDGLTITMLPAGTTRDEPPEDAAREAIRAELEKFRNNFEFTILIASLAELDRALKHVPASPLVLCGAVGETEVDDFARQGALVQAPGIRLHGLVLWDAPRPNLPSRAELAAHLSKQKGRTPGGSFQAVKKALSETSTGNIKPL